MDRVKLNHEVGGVYKKNVSYKKQITLLEIAGSVFGLVGLFFLMAAFAVIL